MNYVLCRSVKAKENEKRYKLLDFPWETKNLWNMKVTMIPIVVGTLGIISQGKVKKIEDLEMRGQVNTIQITALLLSARIVRRVLETWGDLLSLKLQW